MSGIANESAFESSIEAHLLSHGWLKGTPQSYDVVLGLAPDPLLEFLAASQPDKWEQLCSRHGGEERTRAKVSKRVADEITARGTVDVLRRGVKDSGVTFRVAFFAPANGLTPGLWDQYQANRLTVVRQLHHSESRPGDSLDVTLFVNGIPTATAELKNPLTHQTVAHAMEQYRSDRIPADLVFRHRAVVHFAVDPDQVYMTTRLAGQDTVFLPFNQGSGGPGQAGGAGNPTNTDGYRTAYLWERVWSRDAWLGLLGSFVHVEDVHDDGGFKDAVPAVPPVGCRHATAGRHESRRSRRRSACPALRRVRQVQHDRLDRSRVVTPAYPVVPRRTHGAGPGSRPWR